MKYRKEKRRKYTGILLFFQLIWNEGYINIIVMKKNNKKRLSKGGNKKEVQHTKKILKV